LPGEIKAGRGTLIGNAGEYGVMAELLKRDWIAALAPRNARDFDIMATNGELDVHIRVKTKSAHYDGFHWAAKKDGTIIKGLGKRDYTVLVDLHPGNERNDYYIVPTPELAKLLKDDFDLCVATPGKKGQPHDPHNRVIILSLGKHSERLESYKEAWDSLWV
jgi:hypothetical protein